jgi:hypothetical protein
MADLWNYDGAGSMFCGGRRGLIPFWSLRLLAPGQLAPVPGATTTPAADVEPLSGHSGYAPPPAYDEAANDEAAN